MYCSPDDLRSEGVGEDQATDERLAELCKQASDFIDLVTGRWFEPRQRTIKLDGNGGAVLPLPHFLIEAESVKCNAAYVFNYVLYNRPEDRDYPKLSYKQGWSRGELNVEVVGLWGYVDIADDGTYVTPSMIRRAAMKIVSMQAAVPLGDSDAVAESSMRGLLAKETTDGHSYELNASASDRFTEKSYTGDTETDQIIELFSAKSIGIGFI
ncbi:MAG: hypothetical protein LBT23_08260 [Synergistaceae bacterium]|jgi:hypothetical protein|nr:hypothetical protein [Synergistaceae bacterium]